MKTQCPHCHSDFKAPDTAAGKESKCPKCGKPFLIQEKIVKSPPNWFCTNCGQSTSNPIQVKNRIMCKSCEIVYKIKDLRNLKDIYGLSNMFLTFGIIGISVSFMQETGLPPIVCNISGIIGGLSMIGGGLMKFKEGRLDKEIERLESKLVTYACPKCKTTLQIVRLIHKRKVRCTNCKTEFILDPLHGKKL